MSLVDDLINDGYLQSPEIISGFRKIKRADFLRPEDKFKADFNEPVSIGFGQTNSQPATVAFMLELLEAANGDKILDVGSGSGWTAALLAYLTGENGRVYGLERIRELKNFAQASISKYNYIKKGVVQLFCTDGYKGLPEFSPFDKIMVSAAALSLPPVLFGQLKKGGKMVIPIGKPGAVLDIVLVEKINDNGKKEKIFPGFIFVPLIKDKKQGGDKI